MIDQLQRPAMSQAPNGPMQSPREIAFDLIRRAAVDAAFLQMVIQRTDQVIAQAGIVDPAQALETKQLLTILTRGIQQMSEMGQAAIKQVHTTMETADAFKMALRKTITQIDNGFQSSMTMYKVAFYVGILMVVASIPFAMWTGKSLLSLAFAGVGAADLIGFFITQPPKDIQYSRAHLAQLQAALFNWFNDSYNWNSYLQTLNGAQGDVFPRVKEVSETLLNNTERMMGLIGKYCAVTTVADEQAKKA